jgi:hypothetical protein
MVLSLCGFSCDKEDSLIMQDIEAESNNTEKIDYDKAKEIMNSGDYVMHDATVEFNDWLETANGIIDSFASKYNDGTLWDEHLRIMREGADVTHESLVESYTLAVGLLEEARGLYREGEKLVREDDQVLDSDYYINFYWQHSQATIYRDIIKVTSNFIEYTYTLLANPDFCSQRGPEEWNIKYQEFMKDMEGWNILVASGIRIGKSLRQSINNEDTGE